MTASVPVIRARGWVAAPIDRAFAFYDDPANLARLVPPPARIEVLEVDPSPPRTGSRFTFRWAIGPLGGTWTVQVVEHVPGSHFRDVTLAGPMRRFVHTHRFRPGPGGRGTWVEDEVDYQVGPGGVVGWLVDAAAGLVVRSTFLVRQVLQRRLLRA